MLVIDDEARDIHLLSEMLRADGYRVFAALSGREGFARALEHHPALILLDLNMPELDGIGTAKLIKSDPRLTDVPLLFLTGSGALDHKLQAFGAGAVDYIIKPFSAQEVLARVRVHARLAAAASTHSAPPATVAARPPAQSTLRPRPAAQATAADVTAFGTPSAIDSMWADSAGHQLGSGESAGRRIVRLAQAVLDQDLTQSITLPDLAVAVGTNERRLTEEFRRHMGLPVFEYVRRQRHRKACELLLHTDATVAAIATQVGFSTPASFSFAFRQYCGMTPSDFRASAGVAQSGD